jgi:predicted nucleic acid-binding Zn ribbon protein
MAADPSPEQAARRRVLAAWRRVDLSEAERARRDAGRSLAEVLPRVLAGIRIDQRPSESQIVTVWRQIMDPQVAAHSQPVSLIRGTLIVAVDSSVWLEEIVRYRRGEILERVQDAMGREVVRKIAFRAG